MPRDFSAELEAARSAGDWQAHARIWDERNQASVDFDEAAIKAAGIIQAAEAGLFTHLSAGQRRDLLKDNTDWTSELIAAIVAHLEESI
jgi:hypothetical protein